MRKFYNTGKSYTTRGLAGLKSKRAGQDAETLLEAQGSVYAAGGRACLWKRHEPYKRLGGRPLKSGFRAVYTGKAGCDYHIILPNGRGGLLELKSRSGDRVRIDAVDELQTQELALASAWGHIAYVVVRLGEEWYTIQYEDWARSDRKSHSRAQLNEIGRRVPMHGGLPDILECIV